jgi:hypothetical protein
MRHITVSHLLAELQMACACVLHACVGICLCYVQCMHGDHVLHEVMPCQLQHVHPCAPTGCRRSPRPAGAGNHGTPAIAIHFTSARLVCHLTLLCTQFYAIQFLG